MWNLEKWNLLLFSCSIMTDFCDFVDSSLCSYSSWGCKESDMIEVTYHTCTVACQAPLSMGFSRQEH